MNIPNVFVCKEKAYLEKTFQTASQSDTGQGGGVRGGCQNIDLPVSNVENPEENFFKS